MSIFNKAETEQFKRNVAEIDKAIKDPSLTSAMCILRSAGIAYELKYNNPSRNSIVAEFSFNYAYALVLKRD